MKTTFALFIALVGILQAPINANAENVNLKMTIDQTLIFKGINKGIFLIANVMEAQDTPNMLQVNSCHNSAECMSEILTGLIIDTDKEYCVLVRRNNSDSREVINTGRLLELNGDSSQVLSIKQLTNLDGSVSELSQVTLNLPHQVLGRLDCALKNANSIQEAFQDMAAVIAPAINLEIDLTSK